MDCSRWLRYVVLMMFSKCLFVDNCLFCILHLSTWQLFWHLSLHVTFDIWSQEGCRVTLNVYDLSQGLARQLSMSFLGKAIEGIWWVLLYIVGLGQKGFWLMPLLVVFQMKMDLFWGEVIHVCWNINAVICVYVVSILIIGFL